VLNQAEELKKEKKSQKSHGEWGGGRIDQNQKKIKILIHIAACQLVFLMFAELKNHLKDYP